MNKMISFVLSVLVPQIVLMQFTKDYLAYGIFITIVFLWFTELIPLAVSALLVPVLISVTGLLPTSLTFSAFGNQIIFLFLGSFLLAKAMQKHGLDKFLAFSVLKFSFFTQSFTRLCFSFSAICWALSMWISNTASCAIITPIALSVIDALGPQVKNSLEKSNMQHRLLLICAYASSIGGLATPVGTPPNLIALEMLKGQGIIISFLDWMTYGLPISLIMLVFMLVILAIIFPVKELDMNKVQQQFMLKSRELGRVTKVQVHIMIIFSLTVILWILPGIYKNTGIELLEFSKNISMGAAAIIGALLLFIVSHKKNFQILSWDDSKDINWGVILLFGGGLCLGQMLNETGLAGKLGQGVMELGQGNFTVILILFIVLGVILSEFSSNTASASILIPILLGLSTNDMKLISVIVIATSFAASYGFMLPVSTPPNAIVYGTNLLTLRKMIKSGIIFDIMGAVVIFVFAYLWMLFS